MTEGNYLLEEYLKQFTPSHDCLKNMNVSQNYVRIFPLLLGSSRTYLSKHFSPIHCNTSTASRRTTSTSSGNVCLMKKTLEENPYYTKYMEKIKKLELSNPDEFQKRMKILIDRHSQTLTDNDSETVSLQNSSSEANKAQRSSYDSKQPDKGLDGILKLEMIKDLSAEEIGSIWVQHYADKDAVSAVVPGKTFEIIQTTAATYPLFVYPVPRQDGYEIFVGQFADKTFHFTSLLNYQRHGEHAPSQLSLRHYTELLDEKGIVLMSGVTLDEGISVTDAQLLAYLVQYFYNERVALVRQFNQSPSTFEVNLVISEIESGLLAKQGGST